MTEETTKVRKARGPRTKKMYIVTMNGEVYFINAISKSAAINFAVSETVKIRPASLADMPTIAEAISKGSEVLEA